MLGRLCLREWWTLEWLTSFIRDGLPLYQRTVSLLLQIVVWPGLFLPPRPTKSRMIRNSLSHSAVCSLAAVTFWPVMFNTKNVKWKVQAKLLSKRVIQNSREHMSQLIVSGVTQYLYNYSSPRDWKKLSNWLHREDKTDLVLFHLRNRSLCHKKTDQTWREWHGLQKASPMQKMFDIWVLRRPAPDWQESGGLCFIACVPCTS